MNQVYRVDPILQMLPQFYAKDKTPEILLVAAGAAVLATRNNNKNATSIYYHNYRKNIDEWSLWNT